MADLIKFDDFHKYIDFNTDFIDSNPLQNVFLQRTIDRVTRGQVPLYKFFNVVDDNDVFLSALMVDGLCLIYAKQINDQSISLLSSELEFAKFRRFQFAGTKDVIGRIFELHSVTDIDVQKLRNFYECKAVVDDFGYSPGELQMASAERLDELTELSIQFAEQYDGTSLDQDRAEGIVMSGILKSSMYQWVLDGEICAVAQALLDECDYPVIGHVYTVPEYRGKGYAASIVHRITKVLLEAGNEVCLLATNANNPASNRAFQKAGYSKIGDYILVYKQS